MCLNGYLRTDAKSRQIPAQHAPITAEQNDAQASSMNASLYELLFGHIRQMIDTKEKTGRTDCWWYAVSVGVETKRAAA